MNKANYCNLINNWSKTIEINPPTIVFDKCEDHEVDGHYCNNTIYLLEDIKKEIDYTWLAAHEFLHYIVDLIREHNFSEYNEESFCEIFGDGRNFKVNYDNYN